MKLYLHRYSHLDGFVADGFVAADVDETAMKLLCIRSFIGSFKEPE